MNHQITLADDLAYRLDRLKTENMVLRMELHRAREKSERLVQVLCSVHALLYPKYVTNPAGQVFRFTYPDPHDLLQELSNRIRAIPDQLLREAETKKELYGTPQ